MRHGLWAPGTPTRQRWLIGVFLLAMLSALIPIFSRSFVPASGWSRTALLLAVLCTSAACGLLWYWFRLGLWTPAGPWLSYSPVKRWTLAPLCVGFFLLVLWLDLAMTAPMLLTRWTGEEASHSTQVQKKRGSGRRSCHHQLQLADTRFWLFEFCVDSDAFDQLPEGPLPATVLSRRTALGDYVYAVRLHTPEPSASTP